MNGTYSLPSAPPAREANRDIIFMMLPLLVVACYLYGGRPAVMCCVAVATAVVCDHLTAWMRGRTHDSAENSSIPMALVTTMMLPASVSYYIVIVAVAVGVVLGKEAFGGWGEYPFNPSALGYAVVAVSWPQQVFRYPDVYKRQHPHCVRKVRQGVSLRRRPILCEQVFSGCTCAY